jgi:hypothetical protein
MSFRDAIRTRRVFSFLAVVAGIFLCGSTARGQGCVNARQCTQVMDPHSINLTDASGSYSFGESWLSPRRWQLSVDYRYLHSHRHFVGTTEQTQRAELGTEVNNIIHLVNVAATYDFSPRLSLSVTVPLFFADRYNQRTPDQITSANGIGDISLVGRVWLLRPPAESKQNVSFGFGVKFPSGKPDVVDTVNTPAGPVTRIVDQSIQPGDGGYGLVVDFQGYKAIKRTTLYASGLYLLNPKNTNGVPTGRRPTEAVMSVADQYSYRAGFVLPFPKSNSLVWSIGIRGEGVPSKDVFGKSDGFRRPGYSIDVEPGLIYMKGKNTWNFSIPVPFLRARTRSVPDIIDNRHGDAAFADYVLLVGYSRRF